MARVETLSHQATTTLNAIQRDPKSDVVISSEFISHDGFCMDDPESNLYDLYVIVRKHDTEHFVHFHREDWFDDEHEKYHKCVDTPIDGLFTHHPQYKHIVEILSTSDSRFARIFGKY